MKGGRHQALHIRQPRARHSGELRLNATGRHLRTTVGITDTDRVFHSFRHGVKDALRRGRVDVEAREALLGHSGSTSAVSRGYGATEMLERWGVKVLRDAVSKIEYDGLDIYKVKTGHEAKARNSRKGRSGSR